MSGRFVVLLADQAQTETHVVAALSRFSLDVLVRRPGLIVMADKATPRVELEGTPSAIIGHLFTAGEAPERVIRLLRTDASEIVASNARRLKERYWGGYLAILSNGSSGYARVCRDPSGAMNCYYARIDGGWLLFSDMDIAIATGLLRPKVDWKSFEQLLARPNLPTSQTALTGVNELLPGFSLVLDGAAAIVEAYWSPWDYVAPTTLDEAEIVATLQSTVTACVGAWGRVFQKVLLTSSGGLDSSIVAAVLAREGVPFDTVTKRTRASKSDERHYAEIVAETYGVTLHDAEYAITHVDVARAMSVDLPKPAGAAYLQSHVHHMRRVSDLNGADVVFTGVGGDNVFCFTTSATPLVDRFKALGWQPGLASTLDDICRLTGCSAWAAMRMAIEKASRRSVAYTWPIDRGLLCEDVLAELHPPSHPWLDPPRGALPGRAVHIARILQALGAVDVDARTEAPPTVHPLLSQPILEFCLSVPTWMWVSGGKDRSVARRAFSDTLPYSIAYRTTKGSPDAFCIEVVEHNRDIIHQTLAGGVLSKRGIVDVGTVALVLESAQPIPRPEHVYLSTFMEAEIWARHWEMSGTTR